MKICRAGQCFATTCVSTSVLETGEDMLRESRMKSGLADLGGSVLKTG